MKLFSSFIMVLVALGLGSACSPEESKLERESETDNNGNGAAGKSGNTNSSGKTLPGGKGEGDPNFDSEGYFETVLIPLFKGPAACQDCHVGPRVDVNPRGPQTIYNYDLMEGMLSRGESFAESELVLKVTSKNPHAGGDRCGGKLDNSPCKEIMTWWEGLYGPVTIAARFGAFVSTRYDGTVQGWAVDPDDKATPVKVELYFGNSPDQGGTALGEVTANLPGFDDGNGGSHAFSFKVPDAMWQSGSEIKVHAFATIKDQKVELKDSPVAFMAYKAKAQDFYNANVAGGVTGCNGCHTSSYGAWYSSLISPTPAAGGTATTNVLRVKAAGGLAHGGGNQCGGGNLCVNIEAWWRAEFE